MAPAYPRPYGAPAPRQPLVPNVAPVHAREIERPSVPMRRFDLMWLDDIGMIEETHKVAPAIAGFEASASAFAHGTMIQTEGQVTPIEDLLPGQMVLTRDHGPQPIRWIGSMTLVPNVADPRIEPARLTRITEGSIGLGKPERDLVLGPSARILRRNAVCRSLFGTEAAFAPATAFTDGVSIIDITPVSPVRVFHIMLDGQHVITANGVEVESFHPGRRDAMGVSDSMLERFLELFPHMKDMAGFGQMRVPRLSHDDIRSLEG